MEHECIECGIVVFNNKGSGGICECGATHWASTFDEEPGRTIISGISPKEKKELIRMEEIESEIAIENDMKEDAKISNKRYDCDAYAEK